MEIKIEDCNRYQYDSFIKDEMVNKLSIIPDNYDRQTESEKYYYSSTLPTVEKLLNKNDVQYLVVGKDDQSKLLEQRGYEWISPTLFVGYLFFSQNQALVSITLNVISNYLYDLFKGKKESTISIDLLVEETKTKTIKRINYKGPVEGISKLNETLKEFYNLK